MATWFNFGYRLAAPRCQVFLISCSAESSDHLQIRKVFPCWPLLVRQAGGDQKAVTADPSMYMEYVWNIYYIYNIIHVYKHVFTPCIKTCIHTYAFLLLWVYTGYTFAIRTSRFEGSQFTSNSRNQIDVHSWLCRQAPSVCHTIVLTKIYIIMIRGHINKVNGLCVNLQLSITPEQIYTE